MRKLSFLLLFLASGCSHMPISDYNQGCRDAVVQLHIGARPDFVADYCDHLDIERVQMGREDH